MTQTQNRSNNNGSNRSNNYRGNNNNRNKNRNSGGYNNRTQGNNPGNNTLLDDEYWKGNAQRKTSVLPIHWKSVSIVLATVFVVGALVGGLAVHSASADAKTERTVMICQQGGLLGLTCH